MAASINPYSRSREPVYAAGGMVATSQPLAAQAGLAVLQDGGNAVDAAVATAAALTVLEPTQNGIGGDAFALVWDGVDLHGLNGSGCMPAQASKEALGLSSETQPMSPHGWAPVTVPGAPRAWADLHEQFGQLPFEQLFVPAIHYARHGMPLGPVVAEYWRRARAVYKDCLGLQHKPWWEVFFPDNFEPIPGARWSSEGHASTLEKIATSKGKAFYEGDLAEMMDAFSRQTGGYLRGEDLASHHSNWVDPISCEYRGYRVWEIPPNTQAIAALQALRILEFLEMPAQRENEFGLHLQIEAMKLGLVDALAYVADANHMKISPDVFTDDAYVAQRCGMIGDRAIDPVVGMPGGGDTVYLAVADSDGMMVSFIQSNYQGFGSGLLVPDTGIALHNRGCGFSLESGHPNELAPGKRPFHTIMPGFLSSSDGKPIGPFGVMGAFMQPQGHVQVVLNTLLYQLHPQAALDAPRWRWIEGRRVEVEQSMPLHIVKSLMARGHDISVMPDDTGFGRGQIIWRCENDVLVGGSETRADGQIAAF